MVKIWYIIYSVMDLEPELDTVADPHSFVFPGLLDQDLDYVFGLWIQISIGLPPRLEFKS
jgi:hypothetical protein